MTENQRIRIYLDLSHDVSCPPCALEYGLYALIDGDNNIVFGGGVVGPYGYAAKFDDVDRYLCGPGE